MIIRAVEQFEPTQRMTEAQALMWRDQAYRFFPLESAISQNNQVEQVKRYERYSSDTTIMGMLEKDTHYLETYFQNLVNHLPTILDDPEIKRIVDPTVLSYLNENYRYHPKNKT